MPLQEETTDLHNLANQMLVLLDAQVDALDALVLPLGGFGTNYALSNYALARELRARLLRAQNYAQTVVRQTLARLEDIGPVEAVPPVSISLTPYGIVEKITGFSSYISSGVQNLLADVETFVLNNRTTVLEDQTPPDLATFYDGNRFRAGFSDALLIRVTFRATATDLANIASELAIWIDVGSGARLFEQRRPMLLGYNVAEPMTYLIPMYVGELFSVNGAALKVQADGPVSIDTVSYFITRLHKRV